MVHSLSVFSQTLTTLALNALSIPTLRLYTLQVLVEYAVYCKLEAVKFERRMTLLISSHFHAQKLRFSHFYAQ